MASDQPYLASVDLWPVDWAPRGWALCNGQLMSISQNTALFSILGTYYGGNGIQTFALPDFRGRVPVGAGQGPGLSSYVVGQVGGAESVALTVGQMPLHTHAATGSVTPGATDASGRGAKTSTNPAGNYPGLAPDGVAIYGTPQTINMGATPVTVTVQPSGNGLPFSVLQPFLSLSYIIALTGVFPSRS